MDVASARSEQAAKVTRKVELRAVPVKPFVMPKAVAVKRTFAKGLGTKAKGEVPIVASLVDFVERERTRQAALVIALLPESAPVFAEAAATDAPDA